MYFDQFPFDSTASSEERNEALDDTKHELPQKIERYLAALSRLYAQDGKRALQEITR